MSFPLLPPEPLLPPPPPALPPLPPDLHAAPDALYAAPDGLYAAPGALHASPPHFEDPLVAPRPHKLQPDLPMNMAQSLDEHRGPSPLPPPLGSDWSPSFPQPSFSPHQLSASFASLNLDPRPSSPLPAPAPARDGPPSLAVPLPSIAVLSVQQPVIQHPSADPSRRIIWCRDVLALVDRAHQLHARPSPTSTDPPAGPANIDDPELQKLVNVALSIILEIAAHRAQDPLPAHVAEAIYMRAIAASTGTFPSFIRHDPRSAFRDFERAAKSGHHAAWFKLGREYENFGDLQHARDCFERGRSLDVENCIYRLGMAHLMGQLGFPPDPRTALPLLARAATLVTVQVPQPAYVYGLLLLGEFSHVSIPQELFQLPPGATPQEEARRHLERAAYLNFAPAQYKLGHAYEFATPPFPFDALLSVQYYSLASQQGETEADMALSKWFLCGAEGAFDKDESLAWTFAEKAARRGLPSAEFALGYYSEVGVGGPRDIDVARKWYTRAAQHGNTDASERLQALQQDLALSREEHTKLTDTNLVRKRTQAKQRSDAMGQRSKGPQGMPAEEVVKTVRKNSMMGAPIVPTSASTHVHVPDAQPRYGNGAIAGSPTGSPAGLPAPLPRVDERPTAWGPLRPSGPQGPLSASPRPGGSPHRPPNQQRHASPASSGRVTGTPPLRRQGGPEFAKSPQSAPPPDQPRPLMKPGPQTFADMGVATQRVEEDSSCIIV